MDGSIITYTLDSSDIIIDITGPWDIFAQANGGIELLKNAIIGNSLWDFVSGDTTRIWLNTLFRRSRITGLSLERAYRCDSPNLKRFMHMEIIPEHSNLIISHTVCKTERNLEPIHIVGNNKLANRGLLQRCSICGRINNGCCWCDPAKEHTDKHGSLYVVYTVCQDCSRLLPGSH